MTVRPPTSMDCAPGAIVAGGPTFTMRPFLIVIDDPTTPLPSMNFPFTRTISPRPLFCCGLAETDRTVDGSNPWLAITTAPARPPLISLRRDNFRGLGADVIAHARAEWRRRHRG